MRFNHSYMLTAAIIMLLPAGRAIAADAQPTDKAPAAVRPSDAGDGADSRASDLYDDFVNGGRRDLALRFGWWGLSNSGSKTGVGEWQGLDSSSPFWDVDGLLSDGKRTLDFTATGPESETTQGRLHFFNGPGLTANVDYERFPHRLDHKPALGFNDGPFGTFAPAYPAVPTSTTDNVARFSQDLNASQDYAVRVQEVKANFKGDLAENIRWRLSVFGMQKEGFRQASAMAHCYALNSSTVLAEGVNQVAGQPGGARCHVLSQSQRIDWTTNEVEPAIEARLTDWLSLEYSHTTRTFNQNDQMVFRTYNGGGALPGVGANTLAPYAFVPDTSTDIDRIKLFAKLGESTDAYALGYIGDNMNNFRHTDRHFTGADARISDHSIDGVQVTGYAKTYTTHTSAPTVALNTQTGSTFWGEPDLSSFAEDPINRQFNAYGVTGKWRPFHDERGTPRGGLVLIGGYEFGQIIRENVSHDLSVLDPTATPPIDASKMIDVTFTQPTSNTNKFFLGTIHDWSSSFRSNLKYTFIDTRYPLLGVTTGEKNLTSGDFATPGVDAINSALPTHVDRVELGCTWQPVYNFMTNVTFYVEDATHHSEFARFNQTSYPFIASAWYAPSDRLSLTAGYAEFSSWIDQDITFGSQGRFGSFPGPHASEWEESPSFTAPWRYTGRADVVTLGAVYAWTPRVNLSGGFEYVRGLNFIATPPSPPTTGPDAAVTPTPRLVPITEEPAGTPINYVQISQASRVQVNTFRVSAGLDYQLRERLSTYFRYVFDDYEDLAQAVNSGRSHMFLTGVTAIF